MGDDLGGLAPVLPSPEEGGGGYFPSQPAHCPCPPPPPSPLAERPSKGGEEDIRVRLGLSLFVSSLIPGRSEGGRKGWGKGRGRK